MGLLSSIFKRPEAQSGASYRDGVSDELVEQTRTRARNRLIGALVLVITGVVALPMLFDSEPRPLAGHTRIEVAKASAPELGAIPPKPGSGKVIDETPGDAGVPVTRPAVAVPPAVTGSSSSTASLSPGKDAPDAGKPAAETAAPREPRSPAGVTDAKSVPKPQLEAPAKRREAAAREDAAAPSPARTPPASDARARALLEGREVAAEAAAAGSGRFVVQIAAYADQASLNQARGRVQKMGLKTYTQQVQTGDGTRTRLRVGPFNNRNEADQVLERIKGAGLPGSVLTL